MAGLSTLGFLFLSGVDLGKECLLLFIGLLTVFSLGWKLQEEEADVSLSAST